MFCNTHSEARVVIGAFQIAIIIKFERILPAFTLLDDVCAKGQTGRMLLCTALMSLTIWVMFGSVLWMIEKGRAEMDGSFATVPISLFHTMIFMGGEWDRVDLSQPWGQMVGTVLAIAGIGIVGIPISIFFDGYSELTQEYLEDFGLYEPPAESDED